MSEFTTDNTGSSRPRSIFERAASNGLWMGLYFAAIFMAMVGSVRFGMLNIAVMTLMLFVPYLVYRQLLTTHREAHGMESFAGLWMQGIITFICGSLILCAVSYLFLRFCYPNFMYDSCIQILDTYEKNPDMPKDALFDVARSIADNRNLIRPTDIAVAYLWAGSFTGSILSLILAPIVKMKKLPR